MVDTHCHLWADPLVRDIPGVLSRSRAAGVRTLVVPAVDEESSEAALRLAEGVGGAADGEVRVAVGVHPEVAETDGVDLGRLDAILRARPGQVVAVGEIGLDAVGEGRNLPLQEVAFRRQVALARDHGLPVIVHCRGAFGRMLELLESFGPGGPGGVFHAHSGSVDVATRLAALGFRMGVGGVVTRPCATRVRAVIAALPLEWLVLETDAPYLPTARKKKGEVEPADLPEVAEALASLRGLPVETVA